MLQRSFEQPRAGPLVEKRAVGGKQRRDAVPLTELDTIENFSIHERLAQTNQHHVFRRCRGLTNQSLEDVIGHVLFGLLMSLARTHRTIQIAFGCGLDDVLHR
jgi:hypothetical protein